MTEEQIFFSWHRLAVDGRVKEIRELNCSEGHGLLQPILKEAPNGISTEALSLYLDLTPSRPKAPDRRRRGSRRVVGLTEQRRPEAHRFPQASVLEA